jgi:DNA-directed RNA polymerase specialized sigma24 family protein
MSDKIERHLCAALLDQTITLALINALEKLTPAERVAFVLRDIFGMDLDEVAETVGRTLAACQRLTVSARHGLADARSETASAVKAKAYKRSEQS